MQSWRAMWICARDRSDGLVELIRRDAILQWVRASCCLVFHLIVQRLLSYPSSLLVLSLHHSSLSSIAYFIPSSSNKQILTHSSFTQPSTSSSYYYVFDPVCDFSTCLVLAASSFIILHDERTLFLLEVFSACVFYGILLCQLPSLVNSNKFTAVDLCLSQHCWLSKG